MSAAPPLPRDWTSIWLSLFVAAAMGFLAALGVASALGADALARSWTEALANRATVALSGPSAETDAALAEALAVLRAAPSVADAQALSPEEVGELLTPWLGAGRDLSGLPVPILIDVGFKEVAGGGASAVADLQQRLDAAGVAAEVDGHGEWTERLKPAAAGIRRLAFGALAIISLAAGLTVAIACSAGLAAQSKVVDVLKLVGAEDRYIARIFIRRFQALGLLGAGVGVALAALALLGIEGFAAPPAAGEITPLLPDLAPSGESLLAFLAIPPAFALIATLSARWSVRRALRRR